MPINRQIDEENIARRHIFHSALKKNTVVMFDVEWMRLEIIFLHRSQAQKDEYHGESRFTHTYMHTHTNTQRHTNTYT